MIIMVIMQQQQLLQQPLQLQPQQLQRALLMYMLHRISMLILLSHQ